MKKNLKKADFYKVLPLKDLVVFPNMVVPLIIGRKSSLEAIEESMESEKLLFLVAQKDPLKEDISTSDLYRHGVLARILQLIRLPNGLVKILVEGVYGGHVRRYIYKDKSIKASLDLLIERKKTRMVDEAKKRQLISLFRKYIKLNEELPEEILFSFNHLNDINRITDFIATYIEIDVSKKQQILEKHPLNERTNALLEILKKENEILELKSELDGKVQDQMMRSQRNYYLQEQLRVIKEELGEDDPIKAEAAIIEKRMKQAKLPVQWFYLKN